MSTFKNKNSLRTIEAEISQKLKNNGARPKLTGSYIKKKACNQSRKLSTQLRVSAHKFPIEKELYDNIPKEKRTCKICKSDLIGDEFHYLF